MRASTGKLPPYCGPSVRKLARDLGVDLGEVKGSHPKGRIVKEDVVGHVKRTLTAPAEVLAGRGLDLLPWPEVDFARFGPVERRPLSRVQKVSGANLARNWAMIPHVTNHQDADITELESFRQQLNREPGNAGVKFTFLAFLIKACVATLGHFPHFNASLDRDALILRRYYHIGFAVDTPVGLVVPVIRDADTKGLSDLAREAADLAALARAGKLRPEHMQGGSFSVSSLGGIGGSYFTPIINAPEVAILGIGMATRRPVWEGERFVPRLMLPMSLSWDHRVVDGAEAGRFNRHLAELLQDFRRVLL